MSLHASDPQQGTTIPNPSIYPPNPNPGLSDSGWAQYDLNTNAKQGREPEIRACLARLEGTIIELGDRTEMFLDRTADVRNNSPKPSSGVPGYHDAPMEAPLSPLGETLASFNQRLQNILIQVQIALQELEL